MKVRCPDAAVVLFVLVGGVASPARAATATFSPARDNSIYSEVENSNGSGSGLFAGRTPNGGVRRALLSFNVAGGAIPAGATVTGVTLGIRQTKIGPGVAATFELRPVSAAWGEGSSSGSGQGAAPATGDATWHFRLFNSASWSAVGGDFGAVSGSTTMGTANGLCTFSSQPNLVSDVQRWLDNPSANFGWILRATDESAVTAREFASREGGPASAPLLTVTYSNVPEPGAALALGVAAFGGASRRRRRPPSGRGGASAARVPSGTRSSRR